MKNYINILNSGGNEMKNLSKNRINDLKIMFCLLMLFIIGSPLMAQYGNGSSGAKTFTGTVNLTDEVRTYAQTSTLPNTVDITNPKGVFLVGDMALIIDMTNCSNTGQNWEFQTITEVTSTTISFVNPIIGGFSEGQVIKVPQYTNVTISPDAIVTCHPWDNSTGGVAVLMANGTVTFEGSGAIVGKIDVSGKGFLSGSAGAGGAGGAGGDPGANGMLTGFAGQGIAGAGWGGKKGSVGGAGTLQNTPLGCGSGNSPSNLSNGVIKRILPGGGGAGGKGGNGGFGAGGAGGDSQVCENGTPQVPALKGPDGEDGGAGGSGGDGGAGAGIIFIKARSVSPAPPSSTPLLARGTDGRSLDFGNTAGGQGGIARVGMGAGGGDGANGGDGGNGGAGGAGGFVWITASNYSSFNVSQHCDFAGGSGGDGGIGGNAGAKGVNADVSELDCGVPIPIIPVENEYFCACEDVWKKLLGTTVGSITNINSNIPPQNQIGQSATFTKSDIECVVTTYGAISPSTRGRLSIVCTETVGTDINTYYCDMDQIDPVNGTDDPWDLIIGLAGFSIAPDNYQQCDLFSSPSPDFDPPQYHAPCCEPVQGQLRIEPINGLPGQNGDAGSSGEDGGYGGEDGPDCSITVPLDFHKLCGSGPNSTVEITASGGNGPYTWTQDDGSGSGPQTLPGTGATISTTEPPNGPGRYCVMDADGCTACIDIVDPDPVPIILPQGPTNFFEGGSVTLDAGGGFASYSWTKDGSPIFTNRIITVDQSGEYCVTVSDEYTCEGSDCVEIAVHVCPENAVLECWADLPYLLSGNNPAGGVYSGDGVYLDGSDYYFSAVCDDIPIGGSIDFELTYFFTDPIYGLMSCSFTITVINGGIVNPCLDNVTICRTENIDLIFGNVTFNPYLLAPDVYEVNYTIYGIECTSYVTVEGVLNPSCPHFELEVCITDEPFWMGDIYIDPAALGTGVHYLNCSLSNSCGSYNPWNPEIYHKVTVFEPGTYVCPDITLCHDADPRWHCGVWIDPSELCDPWWMGQCSQVIEFQNYVEPCGETINGSFTVNVIYCLDPFPYPFPCPDVEWAIISLPFQPYPPDIEIVFEPAIYLNQMEVVLSKDGIFWPSGSINTIGDWDVYQAYKIKMNSPGAIWSIGAVPEDKTISLTAGANYIPVLSQEFYPAMDIFGQLGDGLIFAFDLNTELLYWPQGGIYSLDVLEPGKGYLVGMTQPGQANYEPMKANIQNHKPARPKVYENAPWSISKSGSTHFISVKRSALAELAVGDFIGVFNSEGLCAGFTQVDEAAGNILLVAYGNDFTVKANTGLADAENMTFRIFHAATGAETTASVSFDASMPNTGFYAENGQSKIVNIKTGATSIVEGDLNKIRIYPNPTNGTFTIEGIDKIINLRIYNAFGGEVYFNELNLPAKVDLSTQPKGIYFVKVETDKRVFFEKLVIN